jgi:hypothetical protein
MRSNNYLIVELVAKISCIANNFSEEEAIFNNYIIKQLFINLFTVIEEFNSKLLLLMLLSIPVW